MNFPRMNHFRTKFLSGIRNQVCRSKPRHPYRPRQKARLKSMLNHIHITRKRNSCSLTMRRKLNAIHPRGTNISSWNPGRIIPHFFRLVAPYFMEIAVVISMKKRRRDASSFFRRALFHLWQFKTPVISFLPTIATRKPRVTNYFSWLYATKCGIHNSNSHNKGDSQSGAGN